MRWGVPGVLTVTIADLRYRYRQFLIAVIGAGVVLAMAILMAGLAAGFKAEINRTVGGVHADRWVVSDKSNGRLTAVATFPQSTVKTIAHDKGVQQADGIVLVPEEVARVNGKSVSVNVMGVTLHGMGDPRVDHGSPLAQRGQVVADPHVGAAVGSVIRLGSTKLKVVGTIANRTLDGGMPVIYMPLHDAQQIALGGQPLVTAVVTRGAPAKAPQGLEILNSQRVEHQTLQTLASAISSIENSRTLMWVVATIIVAALIYVSALQRVRDFAVLKALGSTSTSLFFSLCLQAVTVTLIAAGFAAIACNFMKGVFDQPVVIPSSAFVTLPIVAVAVGLLSSLVALRTATGADPVAAFGG
jgi:putative ABC transport system permease protein